MKPILQNPVSLFRILKINILCILMMIPATVLSQETTEEDKTTSPYFFVNDSTGTDQLPLKATSAEVNVCGVIADVWVKQTYCNEGTNVIEAIYVFPASTKAAVNYMQMTLGNRILIARIEEKQKAREEYEEAKEEGKTATLLEQNRPNVFQMNVANILPGDTIVVEMHYTELITPVERIYEFVYPTVVGPRYKSPSEDGEGWVETPYFHEGEKPPYTFEIKVNINAGLPISEVSCPSHPAARVFNNGGNSATCLLDSTASDGGNKDFIMDYRLSGDELKSGLLLYEGEDENFFLAMTQPPKSPREDQIPPREYIFIMDVSGSMYGFPIDISKTLLVDLISKLRPTDKFNVLFFAGGNELLAENSLAATMENIQKAVYMIEQKTGSGGTELLPALERALHLPCSDFYSRTFVIATDGYVSIEKEAFDLIRNNLSEANFFPFGIGSGVNRYIIEGMAHVGMTEPLIITSQEEAYIQAEKFREYIQYPVLTDIKAIFEDFDVYDVEPLSIPDVMAQRPVLLFGKYNGLAAGNIKISGLSGSGAYHERLSVNDFVPSESNAALRYLWARFRIQLLDDYATIQNYYDNDSALIKEITQLGLKYNLLTNYTSFIAVDSMIRRDSGDVVTVKQPLPLPEGVSDYAVGDSYGATTGWNTSALTSHGNNKYYSYGSFSPSYCDSCSFIDYAAPNPFSAYTFIRIHIAGNDEQALKSIEVFDYFGKTVFQEDLSSFGPGWHSYYLTLQQNFKELPAGIYYMKLKIGNSYVSMLSICKI